MNLQEYDKCVDELTRDRSKVSESKREDYTRGDEDVLKNFKNQAEALGVTPEISLAVHMEKQFSAVLNYIKTEGESESEPIIKRIGDTINYLELLWGLINEEDDPQQLGMFDAIIKQNNLKYKDVDADMYPETPDDAFHKTKIKTIKFRLRDDVKYAGLKGNIIQTSRPTQYEYFDEAGDKVVTNLFEDERFEEVE